MIRARVLAVAIAGLLATALLAAGCGGSKSSPAQPISGNITGESIQAYSGTDFQVALASNPTTGYEWTITTVPDPNILTLKGTTFVGPTGSNAVAGSGGLEVWTFHAYTTGSTSIVFQNKQVGGAMTTPPAQTHNVAVTIMAAPPKPPAAPKTYTNSNTPIIETVGSEFLINIQEQTASTGFKWVLNSSYDHGVVVFEGAKFVSASGAMGAAQTETWRFLTVGKGTTKLTFSYVQPFNTTAPASQTKTFAVTVN